MQEDRQLLLPRRPAPTVTQRSVFAALFCEGRLILIVFCTVFIQILIAISALSGEYESD